MINYNGNLVSKTDSFISSSNRGYAYGDALFETIRVVNNKILFLEAHYFRLMGSMRIMRMEIPMNFTMEFMQAEIFKSISANQLESSTVRVKFMINRSEGGLYTPTGKAIDYIVFTSKLDTDFYILSSAPYLVDLFKDFYVSPSLLSTLKTNNKALNIIGSVFAKENDYDNCLLLNTNKSIVEALNGNIFLVKGNTIKTPPLSDGCLKGVLRGELIEVIKQIPEYTFIEASISPFELQKADELFITNTIVGIQPITKYRKKSFTTNVAKNLLAKLNMKIRLS